ncbi:aminotransferase class I/II-fold pyridoxal phosphate-dependent enzyme [candidate division KSB1 bacterium]
MEIPEFKLERFFAEYEFNVPYMICSADCEPFTVRELFEFRAGSADEFNNLSLGYTESAGKRSLRHEITNLYKTVYENDIIVHAGAEEAIFTFMNSVLNADDHIIVQYPTYQSLYQIADSMNCEVTRWKGEESNEWDLDLNFLKNNINKLTKAVILNFPNNPTGSITCEKKFKQIIEICRKNDLLVFSDEVYRFLEYNEIDRLPAACDIYENAVSLGVMSKAFALPGLRIGWIASRNRDIISKISRLKDYTTICNSAPSEYLAELALKYKDKIIYRNLKILGENLIALNSFMFKYSDIFSWSPPKGGITCFPRIKFHDKADVFAKKLLKEKGLLIMPGGVLDYDNRHLRIGFGRSNFTDVLVLLEDFVRGHYL